MEGGVRPITAIKAQKLLSQGCEGFFYTVLETEALESSLKDITIVHDFRNVFWEEIPAIPPSKEVEFCNDLVPGAIPISKSPYKMPPTTYGVKDQIR